MSWTGEIRQNVVEDPQLAQRNWKIIEEAIHQIFSTKSTDVPFWLLYRKAYDMVIYKSGDELLFRLGEVLGSHVDTMVRNIEEESQEDIILLEYLVIIWENYSKSLKMIHDIVMYWDRMWMLTECQNSITLYGQSMWKEKVIEYSRIQRHLQNVLIENVMRERKGEAIDRVLMKKALQMLMELGGASLYIQVFEKPFLEASVDYYRDQSLVLIKKYDCGKYLKEVERRRNEELDRVYCYMDVRTEKQIKGVVEDQMISNHMFTLLHMEDSGLVHMIIDDDLEGLQRMYGLFSSVLHGILMIRQEFTSHLKETGEWFLINAENHKSPTEFVTKLIEMREKYMKIISFSFKNDRTFMNALDSSFVYFVNSDRRSREHLSLFLYEKKCEKDLIFDKAIVLFHYLKEKDVNEAFIGKLEKLEISNVDEEKETGIHYIKIGDIFLVDRTRGIDAAIARIMKVKKDITVADVIKELQLQIGVKKSIEALIERGDLKRDASDRTLRYIA